MDLMKNIIKKSPLEGPKSADFVCNRHHNVFRFNILAIDLNFWYSLAALHGTDGSAFRETSSSLFPHPGSFSSSSGFRRHPRLRACTGRSITRHCSTGISSACCLGRA
jgi:hypothetical protein